MPEPGPAERTNASPRDASGRWSPAEVGTGGLRLVPLQSRDAAVLGELLATGDNVLLLGPDLLFEGHAESAIRALCSTQWAFPMCCVLGEVTLGLCFTAGADVGNLNARLGTLFRDPGEARPALALYLRQLFASYPVHRLFTQVPVTLDGYVRLYGDVGFRTEGVLREHLWVSGAGVDVVSLGMLREDFAAWAAEHAPALRL